MTRDTRQAQAARQALFCEMVLAIARAADIDSLFTNAVEKLAPVIEFDRCTLALPGPSENTYLLRTLHESREKYAEAASGPTALQSGIPGAVLRTGSAMAFPDLESADGRPPPGEAAMEGGSIRSILSLPLGVQGKVLGAITFGRSEKRPFDEDDESFIRSLTDHLATALDRLNQARDLRDLQERHDLALYASKEALWDWDLRSNDLYISPQTKELLGLPPGSMAVTTQEWQSRIHPEDLAVFRDAMRAYLRGETEVFREEFRVKDRAGTYRWVLHQGFGLRDASERVYRMAGSMGDITARKSAEIELNAAKQSVEEANRTKDAFLADLSYALRIPLNAIIGYSELLGEEIEDLGDAGKQLKVDLDKIRYSGRNLLDVIDTILDHFKIDAGLVDVEFEIFDVEELVIDIGTSIGPLIEDKRNRLEITLDPNVGTMYSDATKVRRVIFNLLNHAAKLTESATILLSAARQYRRDGDTIVISVACSALDAKAFEMDGTHRAPGEVAASSSSTYGGPGLGLAVSQYYCDLLGGEIAFDADPVSGSVATITLPASAK